MSGVVFAKAVGFRKRSSLRTRRAEVTAWHAVGPKFFDDSSAGFGAGFAQAAAILGWARRQICRERSFSRCSSDRARRLHPATRASSGVGEVIAKTMASALFLSKSMRHLSATSLRVLAVAPEPPQEYAPWRHAVVRWRRTKINPGASFLSTIRRQAKRPPQPLGRKIERSFISESHWSARPLWINRIGRSMWPEICCGTA